MLSKLGSFVLVGALYSSSAFAVSPIEIEAQQKRVLASYGQNVSIVLDAHAVPSYLMGKLSPRASFDAREAADTALAQHGAAFRRGPLDGFTLRLQENDQIGMTHVRMTQTYKGMPVVGGELIVHLSPEQVLGINGRFVADLDLDVHTSISDSRAAGAALALVASLGGHSASVLSVDEAVVFAQTDSPARLAIPVMVEYNDEQGPQMDIVYVDGHSGSTLGRFARVYRAKVRKIYNANQACISTGNELPGTLLFNEGGSSSDTAAMGAYNGTGTTYDFYSTVFGRNSYDNAGATIVSSVHAQFSNGASCSKDNAAWFDAPQNQMAYGDGTLPTFSNLANGLDVTGHEMTHAVTSRTANLAYQKESGALNEGTSDILGRSTAFWFGNGSPATKTDWAIGADVYTPGTAGDALRYMYDPKKDGSSADYYPTRNYSGACTPSSSNDECGVHSNSGIANLFYYLLSQGGTHPRGSTTVNVPGIGITSARQIWYRALSVYMTSATTFQGARTATASAAADLYGGSCSATWQSVQKGWDAVGVPGTWTCGGPATLPESAHPYTNSLDQTWTYTLAGSPASINVLFDAQTSVEATYDFIYVMDKNGVNIAGSPFTGTTLASATKNVVGDTVKIRLTSDTSVTAYGFKVTSVTAGGGGGGDTTPPTTSVTAPANGATVSGTTNITATASDNVGVSKIEIYVDGVLKGSNTASTTFTYAWATTSVANGSHTITSKAYDAANNIGTSATITVTVNNTIIGQQLLGNPGFESGVATPWVLSAGVLDSGTGEAAHAGSWKVWMNGYAAVHTDTVMQQVTIPAASTSATLTFWLHIDTAETGTTAYDKLNVQIRNSSGAVLATLATYSNANAAAGYTQKSFNLIAYKGQTIQVNLVGVEDASLQTSFVVDDFALNVQ